MSISYDARFNRYNDLLQINHQNKTSMRFSLLLPGQILEHAHWYFHFF